VARGIPAAKIEVRTDFIASEEIGRRAQVHRRSGRRLLPFSEVHPVVGVVGRLTPFKQQDLFLRAARRVLEQVPEARFVIVGKATVKERHYEEGLLEISRSLGLTERVAFLGDRPDAAEIISELSVLCAPSSREPLGRTILEAQIVGTPVVASDAGGIPEIVEEGVTGLLFPATGERAEAELAERVVRILRNEALRSTLVRQGRAAVLQGAGNTGRVRDLEETLRGLAEGSRKHAIA
jgi:glycosyltransferase involved in cell wall biosynthesis